MERWKEESLCSYTETGYEGSPSHSLQFSPNDTLECSTRVIDNTFFDPMHHRESICSSSGSSIYEPDSPMQRRSSTFSDAAEDDTEDAPWNLVAYHVPWGPGYEGYEAGTLPGPDGTCVFLRSPTPLKRQRTSQACDKCRERKAKCSGSRPSCARCTDRGLACVYSASPVISDASLPARSLTRRLSVANSKEHLRLSARNRMRRKSSPGVADPAIEDMNARPNLEFRAKSQPSIFTFSASNMVDSWRNEYFHDTVATENRLDIRNGILDQSGESCGVQYDQGNITQEFRVRNASAFYAQPMSHLDSYRFPPPTPEDSNEMAIFSTEQLQSVCQSEFFSEDPASQDLHISESQLWNDTNRAFQSPGPPSDVNFLRQIPSSFQGVPYLSTGYTEDPLELTTELPVGTSAHPAF